MNRYIDVQPSFIQSYNHTFTTRDLVIINRMDMTRQDGWTGHDRKDGQDMAGWMDRSDLPVIAKISG